MAWKECGLGSSSATRLWLNLGGVGGWLLIFPTPFHFSHLPFLSTHLHPSLLPPSLLITWPNCSTIGILIIRTRKCPCSGYGKWKSLMFWSWDFGCNTLRMLSSNLFVGLHWFNAKLLLEVWERRLLQISIDSHMARDVGRRGLSSSTSASDALWHEVCRSTAIPSPCKRAAPGESWPGEGQSLGWERATPLARQKDNWMHDCQLAFVNPKIGSNGIFVSVILRRCSLVLRITYLACVGMQVSKRDIIMGGGDEKLQPPQGVNVLSTLLIFKVVNWRTDVMSCARQKHVWGKSHHRGLSMSYGRQRKHAVIIM